MISIGIEFLIYLVEMTIAFYYVKGFWKKSRYSSMVQFLIWFIGYLGLFLMSFLNTTWINIVFFLIINTLIIVLVYNPGYKPALFHSLILTSVMALSESIMIALYSLAAAGYIETRNYSTETFIAALMSKVIYFIAVLLLRTLFRMKEKNSSEGFKLLFVPIVTLGLYFVLIAICRKCQLDEIDQISICVVSVGLLSINFLVIWERKNILEKGEENIELNIQIQREKDMADYYRLTLKRDEELKVMVHDYKRHLQSIGILCREGKMSDATSYVEDLLGEITIVSKKYSENKLVDAILMRYSDLAEKKGISFSADIRTGTIEFMKNEDITSLLSNIVENAYESAESYNGTDAFVDIRIYNSTRCAEVMIVVVNSCKENPFDKNGVLLSKKFEGMHGIGMKSVKDIINKYNGDMTMYYSGQENAFHMIISLCMHNYPIS